MSNDNTEVMRITRTGVWVNPDMSIDDTAKAVLAALDSQIKVLVQAEREACAKFIEDGYMRQFENPWREDLAAAIRNRSTT